MDLGDKYFLMCKEAKELQIADEDGLIENEIYELDEGKNYERWDDEINQFVWLPRQDQLLKMLNISNLPEYITGNREYGSDYEDLSLCYDTTHRILETSGEIFWLCATMFKLYNKYWDGREWKIY